MPKVSVIIPVYGVERYIERCARSLFNQTLDNIECIFVDDCTPDKSMDVLQAVIKEYRLRLAEKNSVVRIITMPSNSGQAAVRRRGIIESTGDYIIHCDSDDWVDITLYETMYNKAISEDADIVVCDMMYVFNNHSEKSLVSVLPDDAHYAVQHLYEHYFHMSTANKLVKRSILIENEVYPISGINMWEDNCLMYRIFYHSRKLTQVRDCYYYYNKTNETSISTGYGEKAVNQMLACADFLTDFFESRPDADDFRNTVATIQFLAKVNLITDNWSGLKKYRETYPGAEQIASKIDPHCFTTKARVRKWFVTHHLAWLFVLLFKLVSWTRR